MSAEPMARPQQVGQHRPTPPARGVPSSESAGPTVAWIRCVACSALVYRKRLRRNLDVCPECGDHHRLSAPERIRQLVDAGTFVPLGEEGVPDEPAWNAAQRIDPIGFVDSVPYPDRLAAARQRTGLAEAVVCGEARIEGWPVVLAVMDFRFLGGSLGCTVGGLIVRAAERALARHWPLILVTASGGARMQEGALALMQMAAVSQAIATLRESGPPTISVVTDPTYGGVAASFATNTDLVLVESGARMGFAGPRVIRQTIGEQLPEGFQTAPFLLRNGQVDLVVERHRLRARLAALLTATSAPAAVSGPAVVSGPDDGVSADGVSADGVAAGDPHAPLLIRDPERLAVPDAWRTVRRARQTDRPTALDYLSTAFDGFVELHGDRIGADCPAIVAGLARLAGLPVAVIGHQKGHRTADLLARNFGMSSPAGYRKAQRVMRLAVRLGMPVVTLIDTPGAHPGVDAERHGQAAAIADCILTMTGLPVPVVAAVTGEGGSGGALALAVADQVLMLEHAVYSVISPEGCAAILWNDPAATRGAAHALRLTAPELLRLGVADAVVPEPEQGAHADPAAAAALLRQALGEALRPLLDLPGETLVHRRRQRFRRYAAVATRPGPR